MRRATKGHDARLYWSGVRCTAWNLVDAAWVFTDHVVNHALCDTALGYKLTCMLAQRAVEAQDCHNQLLKE